MNGHAGELARLGALRGVNAETAAAARLCGLALDAGLVGLGDLRAAVGRCSTRAELNAVLLMLLGALGGAATQEERP